MAEIDLENQTLALCQSIPDHLDILSLHEIKDLMIGSKYLANRPCAQIKDICAQTLLYKQPFLEGFYVKKNVFGNVSVFGCVDPVEKHNSRQSQHPIILVFCDAITQSNFLWNNKPLTVNAKQLTFDVNYATSKTFYRQIELLPVNVVANSGDCGGVRYGDQIIYEGPLVVVFD